LGPSVMWRLGSFDLSNLELMFQVSSIEILR
jgi:hypothetical protein